MCVPPKGQRKACEKINNEVLICRIDLSVVCCRKTEVTFEGSPVEVWSSPAIWGVFRMVTRKSLYCRDNAVYLRRYDVTKSPRLTAIFFLSCKKKKKRKEKKSLPFSLSHVMIIVLETGYDRNRVRGATVIPLILSGGMTAAWHFPSIIWNQLRILSIAFGHNPSQNDPEKDIFSVSLSAFTYTCSIRGNVKVDLWKKRPWCPHMLQTSWCLEHTAPPPPPAYSLDSMNHRWLAVVMPVTMATHEQSS